MTGIIEGSLFPFGIFLSGMPLAPWLKKGFFGGGGGVGWGAFVYSSFLEKQMRKIYDQFGTTPSNKTQTLKFPLLRFVSSNPLQKKI